MVRSRVADRSGGHLATDQQSAPFSDEAIWRGNLLHSAQPLCPVTTRDGTLSLLKDQQVACQLQVRWACSMMPHFSRSRCFHPTRHPPHELPQLPIVQLGVAGADRDRGQDAAAGPVRCWASSAWSSTICRSNSTMRASSSALRASGAEAALTFKPLLHGVGLTPQLCNQLQLLNPSFLGLDHEGGQRLGKFIGGHHGLPDGVGCGGTGPFSRLNRLCHPWMQPDPSARIWRRLGRREKWKESPVR